MYLLRYVTEYSTKGVFKQNGEMLVRSMSEKAQAGYNQTDPCEVFFCTITNEIVVVDSDGGHAFCNKEETEKYLESLNERTGE